MSESLFYTILARVRRYDIRAYLMEVGSDRVGDRLIALIFREQALIYLIEVQIRRKRPFVPSIREGETLVFSLLPIYTFSVSEVTNTS